MLLLVGNGVMETWISSRLTQAYPEVVNEVKILSSDEEAAGDVRNSSGKWSRFCSRRRAAQLGPKLEGVCGNAQQIAEGRRTL